MKIFIIRCWLTVTKAEEFHNLPSTRWRPRKVCGIFRRPESQQADGTDFSLSLKPRTRST